MTATVSDTVTCPYCGAEVIKGSDACASCGQSLWEMMLPEWAVNISESHFTLPISAIRLSQPVTVPATATVGQTIAAMADNPLGAAVIVDGSKIAGVFTDRDVLSKVAASSTSMDAPISEYMTPDPAVLRDDDTMATALHKMGAGGFRHIPLTRDGELVAMVTARDILSWLLSRYFDE